MSAGGAFSRGYTEPTLTLVGLNSNIRSWSSAFTSTPRGMNTSPASLQAALAVIGLCLSLDAGTSRCFVCGSRGSIDVPTGPDPRHGS